MKTIFFHVPKTGGTSLRAAFEAALPSETICPERHDLCIWNPKDLLVFEFFAGHFPFSTLDHILGEKCIVTMLRDPKDQLISWFYFAKAHTWKVIDECYGNLAPAKRMSLIEYLEAGAPNRPSFVWQLASGDLDLSKQRLETFEAVGILEQAEESYTLIFNRLGVTKPTENLPKVMVEANFPPHGIYELQRPPREEITPYMEQLMDRVVADDRLLYEYGVELFERAKVSE